MEIRALISCFMEDESIQSFHLIYFIKLRRLSAVSHKMMNCVLLFYDFICFLWSVTTMKMKRTRRFLSPVLLWPRAERDFVSWSESLFFLFNKVVVSRDDSLLYFHHAHHVRRLIPGLLPRCSQTTDRVKLVWGQFIRELTHSVSSASVSVTNWDDLWADRKIQHRQTFIPKIKSFMLQQEQKSPRLNFEFGVLHESEWVLHLTWCCLNRV